ncbi:Calx-beta domain-containing protein [Angustibacter sp. McL0619]|uniref:Calx-beta domain-containing protein n=1 Tax=Angustibacter sp. McL0619 TaxID=3415676 RepID=UPI003CF0688C
MKCINKAGIGAAIAAAVTVSGIGLGAGSAFAAATPSDSVRDGSSWKAQAFEAFDGGGNGHLTPRESDVQGPGRAPFGTGSHQITIGESTAQAEIYRTTDFDETHLADISRLAYSTFAQAKAGTDPRQPSAMRLAIDTDGDGERDHKLYFFPANNADQQPIDNGVWQNWDVRNGRLSEDGDAGPHATVSWDDYVAANPTATIVSEHSDSYSNGGGLGLLTGGALSGNGDSQINGEYFVDRVIVGVRESTTLYDLGLNGTTAAPAKALTVEPGHLQGWDQQAYDYVSGTPLALHQSFVRGAGTAPHGLGSMRFELNNDSNPNRVERLRTSALDGMLVRDLSKLTFSTLQQPDADNATPQQPVYLRVNIDTNGDLNDDERMYFYPGNNAGQQTVAQGTWQKWDAGSGKWSIGSGDTGPENAVTLKAFLAEHPDATIVANPSGGGGVAFQVGGGGTSQMNGAYYLDDVVIGTASAGNGSVLNSTSYDLEPTVVPPTVAIGDARVVEGNSSVNAVFPVTLNGPADYDVNVNFATTSGTAKGGSDYVTRTGTVTIPKGKTTGAISVKVVGDKVREANETFAVSLSGASYGSIADAKATGTIVNDDRTVGIKVAATGSGHLSAAVTTTSAAPKSTVSLYTVASTGKHTLVAKGTLDAGGRLTLKPTKAYKVGSSVTLAAVVATSAGTYESAKASVRIR